MIVRTSLAIFIFLLGHLAQASVNDFLVLPDADQLRISRTARVVTVTLEASNDYPELYLTQDMPGGGGPIATLMSAALLGLDYIPKVADWLPIAEHKDIRIGIFTTTRRMTYASVFTDQKVSLTFAVAPRLSIEPMSDGKIVQVFKLELDQLLSPVDLAHLNRHPENMDFIVRVAAAQGFSLKSIAVDLCHEILANPNVTQ